MKTKCFSVRLQSLVSISDKCFVATAFDGREALIPKSQVFGQDYDVNKSEAYWISEWILKKKDLQFSQKKEAYFYNDSRKMAPKIVVTKHIPVKITKEVKHDATLIR